MESEALITVIIPAYNVSKWIERCLDSVISQTYRNLEIIVIDDGSTDNTAELIDLFAEKDERIIPVHQDNAGLIEVRERGIRMAHGQYTGFIDGDDEIEPEMFEKLIRNALQYQADISQCGILYCFYDGRKKPMHGTNELSVFNRTDGCRELLKGTKFEPSLCNKIYKTEILRDSCPDPTVINNEDLLRNTVLFSRCEKSVFEDFCGYHYWRRSDSMSNNKNAVKIGINLLKARQLILENAIDEAKDEALELYLNAAISIYNKMIYRSGNDAVALKKQCLNVLKEHRKDLPHLSRSVRTRSNAILTIPAIYNAGFKIHNSLRSRRIRKEAEKLRNH